MACMEHSCCDCDFIAINNKTNEPRICPKCGGSIHSVSDEYPEPEDYDDTPEDYED